MVVDSLIVEYGVGQYDADWNKIETEWYMKMCGPAVKLENLRHGYDVEIFTDSQNTEVLDSQLYYPNIRNVKDKKGIAFFAS